MKKIISAVVALSLLFGGAAFAAHAKDSANRSHHDSSAKVVNDQAAVNLNTADVKTLMTLKIVGKTRAQRIIDYRNEHGNFKSVSDLSAIPGFSQKLVDRIIKENSGRLVTQ